MKITFERKDDNVTVAFVKRPFTTTWGAQRYALTALRTMREAPGIYRIDRCDAVGGVWAPWEAVNETEYPTTRKAQSALRQWARSQGAFGAPA